MPSPIPVALQLWTLRHECAESLIPTLERVALAGYRWIEPYDFYGLAPAEWARAIGDIGLGVLSSHVGIDLLETRLDQVMDDHDTLGCKSIVCPWLDEARRRGPDAFEKVGDLLDEAGARLRERGFSLAYHNHDFEFTEVANPDGLQRILARAKPENLSAQLDTYWAERTGRDPATYMRALGRRLSSVHLKDRDPDDGRFAPIGFGALDMREIVREARALGVREFVVEQDEHKGDPFENITRSLEFLRQQGLDG